MNWKKEFLDLYTSEDNNLFNKALELKKENFPKYIYRYRSLEDGSLKYRLDEIENATLYLSHPKDLNDPFEACSCLESTNLSTYAPKEKFKERYKDLLSKEEFTAIFESEDWFDKLIMKVFSTGSTNDGNNDKEKIKEIIMSEFIRLNSELSKITRNHIRLACFTTKANNLPMWSHYADNHKGFCFEFCMDDISNVYQRNRLLPVIYVIKIPDVTKLMLTRKKPKFILFDFMAMHKINDWKYEDEWRLIYNVGSWYYSLDEVPNEFWEKGKKIQFIKPSRIILGANIKEDNKRIIIELARRLNISVVQAKITEFGLEFE